MSRPRTSKTLDRVELLAAELKAIELWDVDYWRKARPEIYETLAFKARRARRAEILSQLRRLIPRLENDEPRLKGKKLSRTTSSKA